MSRIWRLGVSAGALVLLAGCQSFIGAFSAEDNLEAARNAGPPAGAFEAALQQEYIAIAQIELDEYDFEHADTFALKAIAAANGETCSLKIPATGLYPGTWPDSSMLRAANSSWPWTITAVARRQAMRPRLRPCSTAGYRNKS
jgi:hypothetical protein